MSTGGNTAFWEAHATGLAALLKLRPIPRPRDGHKFGIFQFVNMQMVSVKTLHCKGLTLTGRGNF
jgi:hypothetical protein